MPLVLIPSAPSLLGLGVINFIAHIAILEMNLSRFGNDWLRHVCDEALAEMKSMSTVRSERIYDIFGKHNMAAFVRFAFLTLSPQGTKS